MALPVCGQVRAVTWQQESQRLCMRQLEAALQKARAAAAAAARRQAGRGPAEQKLPALEAQLSEAKEAAAQRKRT